MTPHIKALPGSIAPLVLMPGDPLRAKFIAETFLTDVKEVSNVRNMLMFTGKFNNQLVSICGSGMGQPSIGIYAYELFKFYNVQSIVRIGTAGAYDEDLKLYDVVLATSAYSDSTSFSELMTGHKTHLAEPDLALVKALRQNANELKIDLFEKRVHSSDVFYNQRPLAKTIEVTQAACVEMESAALFHVAKLLNKRAACLLTISDHLVTHLQTSAEERQSAFMNMVKIALSLTTKLAQINA